MVFSEGQPCAGLYVVERGNIRIFKSSAGGREQVLSIDGPGSSVAEVPVFDGGSYPASGAAVDCATLLFVGKQDFQALCLAHPDVALKVLHVVGARLRRLVGIIEELSFTTVRHRLVSFLLRLAQREGTSSPAGVEFSLPGSNQELAAQLGTVRELVSRNLSRLQAEGLLKLDGRRAVIPDLKPLEAAHVSIRQVADSLAAASQAASTGAPARNWQSEPLAELLAHIRGAHHVNTRNEIARLGPLFDKVRLLHGGNHPELLRLREIFSGLAGELTTHLMKEEMVLFPYILRMEEAVVAKEPLLPPPFGSVRSPIARCASRPARRGADPIHARPAAPIETRRVHQISQDAPQRTTSCFVSSRLYGGFFIKPFAPVCRERLSLGSKPPRRLSHRSTLPDSPGSWAL
jgi:CRP/FNR family transcriptional regulator